MGYTHYWSNGAMEKETFEAIKEDAMVILDYCEQNGIAFGNYKGTKGTEPVFKEGEFGFNGVDGDAHETFSLEQEYNKYNFCKTARKPYDLAVCMVLLSLTYHFADSQVRSDGWIFDEWVEPIETWHKLFPNRSVEFSYDGMFIANESEQMQK